MPAISVILAALAAAQMPGAPAPHGRPFLSPMGEPFHVVGADGLTTWFQQADANHDGYLVLDEMRQDAQRFYLVLDANKDGEIDPDELDHYETVIAPEVRVGSGWGGGAGADDESSGGGRLGVLNIPEPVATADANLDRGISAQEFQVAAEKRFRVLDLNGDGRLTLAELQSARSAVRSNARRPHRDPDDHSVPQPPSSDLGTMGPGDGS